MTRELTPLALKHTRNILKGKDKDGEAYSEAVKRPYVMKVIDKEFGEDRTPARAPSITNIESIQILIGSNLEEDRT